MECWNDDLIRIPSLLQYSNVPASTLAAMSRHWPRLFPLLCLCGGYAILMIFSPVRHALGDGFRCIRRYKRIWISFALLGFGYFLFQFVTFTPIRNWADLDLNQIISLPRWYWPRFVDIWRETPLPALEGVAGILTTPLQLIRSRSSPLCSCWLTGVDCTAHCFGHCGNVTGSGAILRI